MNYEVGFYVVSYLLVNCLVMTFSDAWKKGNNTYNFIFLLVGTPLTILALPFAAWAAWYEVKDRRKEDNRKDAQVIPWRRKDE